MSKVKYIIQDWACNTLQHNGKFNRAFGDALDVGNPKTFKTFEDGWSWISENVPDENDHGDYYVEELK